jgi:hypothetical protein
MKCSIKSKMVALMISMSVLTSALPNNSARAAIGLLALPVPISFAFLAAGAGGVLGASALAEASRDAYAAGQGGKSLWLRISAGFAFVTGAILLDASDETAPSLEFGTLSPKAARKLGLTADEHASFERERLEINLLREETIVRAQKLAEKNPEMSFEQLVQSMSKDWKELSSNVLSKESVSAVQKISAAGLSPVSK